MLQQNSSEAAASGGNIFVSYSWNDRDFTQQIIQLLKDEGYDPQVDRTDIAPSEAWRSRLSEMISSCDTFLFVLTDDWVTSDNCRSEFDEAVAAGKRLIPVVPRALTLLPDDAIAKLNYIYFFPLQPGDGRGFYEGMSDLKRALRFDLERLRLRRRYEDKANGWTAGEDDLLTGDQLTQAETWMKREIALEGVPEQIAAYITASQDARAQAEQRTKRNRAILTALGGFALLSCIGLAVTAYLTNQTLNLADQDTKMLTEASKEWATGRSFVNLAMEDPLNPEFDNLLDTASTHLTNSLDIISPAQRGAVQSVRMEIGLELSRIHFNRQAYDQTADVLFDIRGSLRHSDDLIQARYLMAQALVLCLQARPNEEIERPLIAASGGVRKSLSLQHLGEWATPHPLNCERASAAICKADPDCEPVPVDLGFNDNFDQEVTQPGPPRPTAPGGTGTPPPSPAPSPETPTSGSDTDQVDILGKTEEVPTRTPLRGPDPFQITDIYLHISDEAQRTDAETLAIFLEEEMGYRVLGIELVPAAPGRNRSVRYYYDQQEAQAEELRVLCADIAAEIPGRAAWANPDTYRVISLDGRYGSLPRNRIEIWL